MGFCQAMSDGAVRASPHTPTVVEPSVVSASDAGDWCSLVTEGEDEVLARVGQLQVPDDGLTGAGGYVHVPLSAVCGPSQVAGGGWKSAFSRGEDLAVTVARAESSAGVPRSCMQSLHAPMERAGIGFKDAYFDNAADHAAAAGAAYPLAPVDAADQLAFLGA